MGDTASRGIIAGIVYVRSLNGGRTIRLSSAGQTGVGSGRSRLRTTQSDLGSIVYYTG
jgi:hypothetical protein